MLQILNCINSSTKPTRSSRANPWTKTAPFVRIWNGFVTQMWYPPATSVHVHIAVQSPRKKHLDKQSNVTWSVGQSKTDRHQYNRGHQIPVIYSRTANDMGDKPPNFVLQYRHYLLLTSPERLQRSTRSPMLQNASGL